MTNKIWYLKSPIWKYYDQDVKALARMANARIIDARFIGDEVNPSDCPQEKGAKKPAKKVKEEEKED